MTDTIRALAKNFFDAVEKGDVAALERFYAPNAKIWHNTDGIEQSPKDNVETLKGFVQRIPERKYDERRLQVFPGGFVHQHKLKGVRAKDGQKVELEACIVCLVDDGRITRLDEYFDSAAVAKFRA
jgi:ketosteroid isomerase-like protein